MKNWHLLRWSTFHFKFIQVQRRGGKRTYRLSFGYHHQRPYWNPSTLRKGSTPQSHGALLECFTLSKNYSWCFQFKIFICHFLFLNMTIYNVQKQKKEHRIRRKLMSCEPKHLYAPPKIRSRYNTILHNTMLHTYNTQRHPISRHGPLTRYVKLRVAHAPGMLGPFPPPPMSGKPLISDPDMHHGTCVTHVPWCMSGSLTRGGGENVSDIPGACTTRNFTYLVRGPCKHIALFLK